MSARIEESRVSCMKYALGGILIAIVLLTIGIGYAMRANAQESLECTYYFDDEDGDGNSAPTSCDSSGLPVPPSNPLGTVKGCAVSRGGAECQFQHLRPA